MNVPEKTLKSELSKLQPFGWTAKEIEMLVELAKRRRIHRVFRYLVGTPRGLATFAEVVPEARQLAMEYVDKLLRDAPLPEDVKKMLRSMWEKYIYVRPVYDEVRRLITELIADYATGVIDDRQLDEELKALRELGIDEHEAQLIKKIAAFRKRRYEQRRRRRGG